MRTNMKLLSESENQVTRFAEAIEEVRQQYDYCIADVIIEMYGNQFTRDDMLDAETGLAPDAIIMEFATMDITVSQRTDKRVEDFKGNFTNGK